MFESLLNFRALGGPLFSEISNFEQVNTNPLNIAVYRCARPDNINSDDLELLQSLLGIKYFLDLRSYHDEYISEGGRKLLDNYSGMNTLNVMDMERIERNKLKHLVWLDEPTLSADVSTYASDDSSKIHLKHYLINVLGIDFVTKWINDKRASLWKRIWGITLLLLFAVFRSPRFIRYLKQDIDRSGLLRLYMSIIDFSGAAICSSLRLIIQENRVPIVICCHAGKDRTGILSAILLSICGYDKDVIAADYGMSELGLPFSHKEMKKYSGEMKYAPKAVMLNLLSYIDDYYGSMQNYLVSIGFSITHQNELRELIAKP